MKYNNAKYTPNEMLVLSGILMTKMVRMALLFWSTTPTLGWWHSLLSWTHCTRLHYEANLSEYQLSFTELRLSHNVWSSKWKTIHWKQSTCIVTIHLKIHLEVKRQNWRSLQCQIRQNIREKKRSQKFRKDWNP